MRFPTLWNAFGRALALDVILPNWMLGEGFLMRGFHPDKPVDVDVLNGWFWMVRREALQEVGPLDPRFFMYGEDIDWSYRFHLKGWRVVLIPGANAKHFGGGLSDGYSGPLLIERERAALQYWRKYHGPSSTAAYRVILCLNHLLRACGHFIAALFKSSKRHECFAKSRRSWACLGWLLGYSSEKCG
jgi:GT2 family glycosyltransferase